MRFTTLKTAMMLAVCTTASMAQSGLEYGILKTDAEYSYMMTDRQEDVTNKPLQQLQYRQKNHLKNQSLYIGGRFIASTMHEKTNTPGKFPIISRLPDQHASGKKGDEEVINEIALIATATPTSWLTAFVQGEYTEVEYPGQEELQLRKYSFTIGDLSRFPVYATFGRNTVTFGNFASYAPFTHNHSSHYFWAQTDDPHLELGYYQDNWHVAATIMQSDRGLRVVNTEDNDGYDNFAFSVRKTGRIIDSIDYEVGAGYLHSTIYDNTVAHHPPSSGNDDNDRNPAYNGFITLSAGDFDFNAEYTETKDSWPATDHKVSALTLQSRYRHDIYDFPSAFTLMYSRGEQGSNGTEWERMEQYVVGYELAFNDYMSIGTEYLYNRGFVPLIMPTITGDRSVESHTFIAGVKLTF